MLSGAPPPTLNQSLVARHQQTWRLHEYHLLLPENSDELTEGDAALEDSRYTPLAPGDPLRAYLSKKMVIVHDSNGISVFEPSVYEPDRMTEKYYHQCPAPEQVTPEYGRRVREILIKGEVGTLHPITSFPFFGFLKLVTFFYSFLAGTAHFLSRYDCSIYLQGHSAWGQFELIGRVRAGDGYVTLSKEYVS
jgi:hypothetical protein